MRRHAVVLLFVAAIAAQAGAGQITWKNETNQLIEVTGVVTRDATCPAKTIEGRFDLYASAGGQVTQTVQEGQAVCWSWFFHVEGPTGADKTCRAVGGDSIRINETDDRVTSCHEKRATKASTRIYDSDDRPIDVRTGFVVDPQSGFASQDKSSKAAATRTAGVHFEKEIAVWRDPLTPPHTKTECCQVDEIDHTGVKVCTRYCTDCQWMYVHAWLVVDIASSADIEGDINQCHDQAVAAGLLTAIVTAAAGGGGGALDAAVRAYVAYFTTCLQSKISQHVIGVRIEFRSGWGGWEGC